MTAEKTVLTVNETIYGILYIAVLCLGWGVVIVGSIAFP
jgi:hypothetical protein